MPFKNQGSKYWKVRKRRFKGFGDTGTLSTGTTNRRLAEAMESTVERVYWLGVEDRRYWKLLEALRSKGRGRQGVISLAELHAGRDDLMALLLSLESPWLDEVIDGFLATQHATPPVVQGLNHVVRMLPDERVRYAWIEDWRNVQGIIDALIKEGRIVPATIRRVVKNAIGKLITHQSGRGTKKAVFAELVLNVPKAKPREYLDAGEIAAIMDGCRNVRFNNPHAWQLQHLVQLALQTSGERGPLCNLRVKDFEVQHNLQAGTSHAVVRIKSTKNKFRDRRVTIGESLTRDLLPLMKGKRPNDRLFDLDGPLAGRMLKRVSEDLGRTKKENRVTFILLRHTFAKHAGVAGLSMNAAKNAMGHSSATMTQHYGALDEQLTPEEANSIEQHLGLATRPANLRQVKKAENA